MSDKTEWQKAAHDNAMQVLADRNAELMERIKQLTAAAEVGEQVPEIKMMPWFGDEINATIERCAQVADARDLGRATEADIVAKDIAAAIRKLKD